MSITTQDEVERLQHRVHSLEQERRHLLAVIEILQEISGSLHFVDIVQAVARRLGEAFGLDRSSIFLSERDGRTVRLVASYEDPSIRNYVVDLERYPELRQALQTGQTVHIDDVATDASLRHARGALSTRRVKSITVVPITWRGAAIGAIFLRTFRDGHPFSDADVRFCQVVASLTARALRNAHRFERLQDRQGEPPELRGRERERAALIGYLRRLLDTFSDREGPWDESVLARASAEEIERLVGVTMAVVAQEATGR
ncbi:MAG TPA: GAF domain-containing protein [Gemmatimonadales bacterium]|jgi:two-component system cell cycle response regulator|nr:GAF domain-containing protein [Gemmatimonadales bacterium]